MKERIPSATARMVTRGLIHLACDPMLGSLVPPDLLQASLRFMEPERERAVALLERMRNARHRAFLALMERITIPGIALHYLLRKRYLEEAAREALEAGYVQVVIIGAGFDSLAFRLHREYPTIRFIEIDHPATQQAKRAGLKALGGTDENLRLIPLDLTRSSMERALIGSGMFDPALPAFFIAEGVTMYLPEKDVVSILRFVSGHDAAARIAFTFMEPRADGTIAFHNATRLTGWWLRMKGEPFLWGIDRRELPRLLIANGLQTLAVAHDATLRGRYLPKEQRLNTPLAVGECICIAERTG